MCLGNCRNARELQLLSKQPHLIRNREEDYEARLDPHLHISLDERGHIRGAGQGVGTLGDECLQHPGIPWGSGVGRNELLYIII